MLCAYHPETYVQPLSKVAEVTGLTPEELVPKGKSKMSRVESMSGPRYTSGLQVGWNDVDKFPLGIEAKAKEAPKVERIQQKPDQKSQEEKLKTIIQALQLEDNPCLKVGDRLQRVKQMVAKYQHAFVTEDARVGHVDNPELAAALKLKTGVKPVCARPRPMHPTMQDALDAQVQEWLADGVIRPSTSPWSSPIVPVKKKDGRTRFCIDYRRLNSNLINNAWPSPHVEEVMDGLGGAEMFSTFDAAQAYLSVPLTEESKPLTAFPAGGALFEFNFTPFGLLTSGASYNRVAQSIKSEVASPAYRVYVDDSLAGTAWDFESHFQLVEKVVEAHANHGVLISPKKSHWFRHKVEFLGFQIDKDGIHPLPGWIDRVKNWPLPKTKKALKGFLGFMQYYASFLPTYSSLTAAMNKLVGKKKEIQWTEEAREAFDKLKEEFAKVSGRSHLCLDPETRTYPGLVLDIDFSATAIAVVLHQEDKETGELRFIGCKTRCCKGYEGRYHSAKGECLALTYALAKFEPVLIGQHFRVRTDNLAVANIATAKWVRQ